MVLGRLFRSGDHSEANALDQAVVAKLGLAAIADLRSKMEREESPNLLPEEFKGKVYINRGDTQVSTPHLVGSEDGQSPSQAEVRERYITIYRGFPVTESIVGSLKAYFSSVLETDGAVLVHCLAGKDRTGIAVALLQRLLGVSLKDVMDDYVSTNSSGDVEARINAQAGYMLKHNPNLTADAIKALLSVEPGYLLSFFDAIESTHGSVSDYANNTLGVSLSDQAELRAKFITKR